MSKFDWSKVTAAQLRDVPQAVVGDDFIYNPESQSLWTSSGYSTATVFSGGWVLDCVTEERARRVIACIDRIANYLTIHGDE